MTKITDDLDETDDDPMDESSLLLPGWITDRMMSDYWTFGLMMSSGITIGIHQISKVWQAADGSIWLDVTLLEGAYGGVWTAPTSRSNASINANHVIAAFELADT